MPLDRLLTDFLGFAGGARAEDAFRILGFFDGGPTPMLVDVALGWLAPGAQLEIGMAGIKDSSKPGMCDTKLLNACKELGNS
jgi:hypothetical protein